MARNRKHQSNRKKICLLSAAMLIYATVPGAAAATVELPDAGNVLRNTQRNERTLPPEERPQLTVEEQAPRAPLSVAAGTKVQVETITVTGQNVVSSDELAALYQDQLHKELTFGDLNQIAAKITQYFKDRGYLVTQAYLPTQEIDKGRVEIAVMVGRYGDIIIKNTSTVDDAVIKRQLSSLQPGGYINNRDLERAVLLAGDLAGVAAKITLYPGKAVGTTDVIVEANNEAGVSHGSFSLNNWGNRFTGSNQGTLYYHLDNAAHVGDSLSLGITNAGSGLDSGYAGYRLPLTEGLALNLGYGKVRYSLGENYDSLRAHGTAYTQHADLNWNLIRSRSANLSLQVGYDHKQLEDLTANSATKKRSHSINLGISGDSQDKLWGGGVNSYALSWYDGSLAAQTNTSAPPTGNWQKATFSLLRRQAVTNRLSALFSFSGQLASTNLDSSEKFSLGGANGVRAYPPNEASGDEGWLMTSELHWQLPVEGSKGVLELIGFYDSGVSYIEKTPAIEAGNRRALAAKGLGLRGTGPNQYAVKLDYAWKAGNAPAQSDTDKSGRLWLQGITYF